jgi:Cdc6-like AAA superfamily ATPase
MTTAQIVTLVAIAVALGLLPAFVAQSKKQSFGLWWVYGAVLFPVALVHALMLKADGQTLEESLEQLGLDEKALRQARTREGLRQMAEDAGVQGEMTSSGWRPVKFGEPAPKVQMESPAPASVAPTFNERPAPVPVDKWIRVGQVFSPAAPITRQDLFAGRHEQMETLIDVGFERGQHAVIFGERGVGKTSMATVMTMVFAARGTKLAVKVNCDVTDTYDTIWRKVLDEIDFLAQTSEYSARDVGPALRAATSSVMTSGPLVPNDVRKILRRVTAVKETVIFVDEFERLKDKRSTALFADTLKMLSDQQVAATVILVGVADNIQQLLSEHQSIERALVQIYMPRMAADELREVVRRGLTLAEMTITDEAVDLITAMSRGLPHFTHLIAQGSARTAIDDGENEISIAHVEKALDTLVEKTQETITESYKVATFSNRETLFPQVLLAAAMAETDEQGFFAAADLVMPLSNIARKPYDIPAFSRHLHALAEKNRGPTLQRKGSEHRYRFRFANPLLQPYVLMKGFAEKMVSVEDLRRERQDEVPA